jgi:hypothetical protein
MGVGGLRAPLRRLWRVLCRLAGGMLVLLGIAAIATTIAQGHLAKGETAGGSIGSILVIWLLAALFLGLGSRNTGHGRLSLLRRVGSGGSRSAGTEGEVVTSASGDRPPSPEAVRAVLQALGRDPATSSHARALIKRSAREHARWQRNPVAWQRRQRIKQVVGTVFVAIVVPLMAIVFTVGAVERHAARSRSSYTQAHGVPIAATVRHTANAQSCGRYSCSTSSTITAALNTPVAGTTITYVHTPTAQDAPAGSPLLVFVDPHEPTYAEIPGEQAHGLLDWIVWSVLGFVIDLAALLMLQAVLNRLRRRRRSKRAPGTA